MMHIIGIFFGKILEFCFNLTGNLGWAIILFTFITKIIMMPVSIIVQLNSIKMVKLYPEMNEYKVKYHGDGNMISEAQYELYKREKYHPMLDLIPVAVQLVLLMGVVEGIYYLMDKGIPMTFMGLNLADIPVKSGGMILAIPIIAALSALLMCITQNKSNVLQSEQGMLNKAITLTISVGLSLYLGMFVPGGIGVYWIASNLFSIGVMYLLNFLINPKKYIDYDRLNTSKEALSKLTETEKKQKQSRSKEEIARENRDYKRFFKYGPMQIVFYSEKNGFYKYFKDIIEEIIRRTNIEIHYISSDPDDEIFELSSDQFHTYYIGENKLIVLMMKIDADIVAMTMPDLQRFQIKRSIIRDDIEYIYIDHGIGSINMLLRKHALDHFDTVFSSNEIKDNEIRAQEEKYSLKPKTIVKYGYGLIDNMILAYEKDHPFDEESLTTKAQPQILIAPSWQADNILDTCIDDILDNILGKGYYVIVRPHPQYVRHYMDNLNRIKDKYSSNRDFELQLDFSSNKTVYDADILMTDWSGIAYEYTFTTLKPTLFINTPMKVINPDYEEIGVVPFDIEIRDKVGISLELNEMDKIAETVDTLLNSEMYSKEEIKKLREKYLYNVGCSTKVGASYIIDRLVQKNNPS